MKTAPVNLWNSLRALPRTAWILFFGTFLNKFGAFVLPFLTIYLTERGFSAAATGLAVGCYGAGNLFASVLGGYLADKIGRRGTIVLSMFSGAAAMLLLSQARSLAALSLLTLLAGLTGELYRPASSALLADLVTGTSQRVTAFSAYRLFFNAGWAFGPATAGLLAGHGYFWLFWGDAATSVLFGIIALIALPRGQPVASRQAGWPEALRAIGRDRSFQQVLVSSLLVALVFLQMASTFGLCVTRAGFSAATYGAILSINGAMVVLFELSLTTVTRRFPTRRVMAAGYLLIGAGFTLNAFVHTVPGFALCVATFTLGEMIAIPVQAAYVADLCPATMRGRYMGVYGLTWAIGMTLAPLVGMRLFEASPALLWVGCGTSAALAALVISNEGKRREVPAAPIYQPGQGRSF